MYKFILKYDTDKVSPHDIRFLVERLNEKIGEDAVLAIPDSVTLKKYHRAELEQLKWLIERELEKEDSENGKSKKM